MSELFKKLSALDVSAYTEKKGNLTYLSWSHAWQQFKLNAPDATYEIKHFDGKPYHTDEQVGYMVETSVTADGETHTMWLPVLDYKNKSIPVGSANMFDINTALMRCLTKNLAMFGLGLYIYAGEDLPATPSMTVEEAVSAINAATTLDELKKAFTGLPAALKKNEKVLAAKDAAKYDFENNE